MLSFVLSSAVMDQVYDMFKDGIFKGIRPAFDGMSTFYMPSWLGFETRTEIIKLESRREDFKVKITESAVVNMSSLGTFLRGAKVAIPQDCLQCLDVIMRTVPCHTYVFFVIFISEF